MTNRIGALRRPLALSQISLASENVWVEIYYVLLGKLFVAEIMIHTHGDHTLPASVGGRYFHMFNSLCLLDFPRLFLHSSVMSTTNDAVSL